MPSFKCFSRGLFPLLFLSLSVPLDAQKIDPIEVDSLIQVTESDQADTTIFNAYRKLFRIYFRIDPTKAKTYLDGEVVAAQKTGSDSLVVLAALHEGIYYGMTQMHQESLDKFTQVKEYYSERGNKKRVSAALLNMASAHIGMGNHKLALENQMESLKLKEELGIEGLNLGKSYFTIGNVYRMSEDFTTSNKWFRKALKEYQRDSAKMYIAQVQFTMGDNLMRLDSLPQAEPMLLDATDYFRSTKNAKGLATIVSSLGLCEQQKGNYPKSMEYYEEALALTLSVKDFNREMDIRTKIGVLSYKQGNYPRSIKNHNISLEKAREFGMRAAEARTLKELAKVYGANNNYAQAYDASTKYQILNDSIQKEDNLAALAEIETKYQTEKKEQEILLLKEKESRNSAEKKGMAAGILGLIGVFSTLLYAMRIRLTKNKLEKAKVDQELDFRNKELAYSQQELERRKQELTAYALQLAHKNEVLEDIKINVSDVQKQGDSDRSLQKVINKIDINQNDNDSWEGFRTRFQAIHIDFESKVLDSFPKVSPNELRLMSLLKMNLSSKEIANILNISPAGIKKARYRLRKKLSLDTSDSLEELVLAM